MTTRLPQEVETEGVRDDGSRFAIWNRAFPTFGPDGAVTGFLEIGEDITESRRMEETLRSIVEGTANVTGKDFLRSLVRQLATVLGFRYAFVGEVVQPGEDRIRTLAVWADGDYEENFEYDMAGTPCLTVVEQDFRFYPKNVQKLFPEDHLLVELEVVSYMGCCLVDSSGRVIGVLATIFHKRSRAIPFGPWIALGALVALFAYPPLLRSFSPVVVFIWDAL